MRIVQIDKVNPGVVLGKSVYNKNYELVVSAGFKLTEEMIQTLVRRKYNYIYIMDELTKDIMPEEVVGEAIRVMTNRQLAETFEGVRNNLAFETFAPEEVKKRLDEGCCDMPSIRMNSIRKAAAQLVDEILENGRAIFASLPIDEGSAVDLQHSLDVTILSVLIGQKFSFTEEEMKQLGTAAMLHDVGKLVFPRLRDKSYGDLTREERMILREHPVYSMMIVRGGDPNAFIEPVVVQQHHEFHDGTGFPNRLKGETFPPTKAFKRGKLTMHRYAEILSAANMYDNLLRGEYDGVKRSPAEAITFMITEMKEKFNPHILRIMPQLIQCYPTGAMVRIEKTTSGSHEGWYGIVARSNDADQSKPLILLTHDPNFKEAKPIQIDLSTEKEVQLDMVL